MFLGIDCGTQGTKALLWDAQHQRVLATSYHAHKLISVRDGQKEQHPQDWLDALKKGVEDVLAQSNISATLIEAIGVSGQQHGLVIMDNSDAVLRPAKLWCDTESHDLLEDYLKQYKYVYGKALSEEIGIHIPVAFTLSKLLWVKKYEADNFKRINKIFLPHDFINFTLTGNYLTEPGDASGTGYFNTNSKEWCNSAIDLIDPDLFSKLPGIIQSHEPHGFLSSKAGQWLGLPSGIVVSSGGGDNMMSAIGTGNVAEGSLTMSLGTSGTLSTCQHKQIDSSNAEDINAFCSSSGHWLPLISTMNVTNAINTYRQLIDIDIADFDNYLNASYPGAEGLFSFPWLNGARLPNMPGIRGDITGITMVNFTKPHLLRSVVEGVTFNLCRGIDILNHSGMKFEKLNVIGGGAKSSAWCQMIADITGLTVFRPAVTDAAALGAAIQAHWAYLNVSATSLPLIESAMPGFLISAAAEAIYPDEKASIKYRAIYDEYHYQVDELKARYLERSSRA